MKKPVNSQLILQVYLSQLQTVACFNRLSCVSDCLKILGKKIKDHFYWLFW